MNTSEDKTATEVIMEALEDFGVSEAGYIIVVYTNKNDDIVCKSNTKRTVAVGLLEVAKEMVLKRFFEEQ